MKPILFSTFLSFISIFFLNGCSIGATQSDCEVNGCNYRKAGLCRDSYEILEQANKDVEAIIERAYSNVKCRDR